jgi:hypothetical protein
MRAQSERGDTADPAPGACQKWVGNSVWQAPELEISRIKSSTSMTEMSFGRGDGETMWRGDRHRLLLLRELDLQDQPPSILLQVERGHARQMPLLPPGSLTFYPAGLSLRIVQPAARFSQVLWAKSSRPWHKRSKAASRTESWSKAWPLPGCDHRSSMSSPPRNAASG